MVNLIPCEEHPRGQASFESGFRARYGRGPWPGPGSTPAFGSVTTPSGSELPLLVPLEVFRASND